jgi:hypothetical protein
MLTLPVKHTSALDHAVVDITSSWFPAQAGLTTLGAGLTALDRNIAENLRSLPREGPVRDNAPRVVLRSACHSELPQPSWRRRRRAKEVGKSRVWRK